MNNCNQLIMSEINTNILPSVGESWLPSALPRAEKSASLNPSDIKCVGTRNTVVGRPCRCKEKLIVK